MTQRFYVYPLFVLAVFHLLPLLRLDWRWHTAQIAQWTLVILAGLGAIYFDRDIVWVYLAWTMFGVFRLAPDLLLRASSNRARLGHWRTAARTKRWAGRLLWGELGALHRGQAAALDLQANGATDQALAFLDELAARPLPAEARGAVHLWKLTLLAATRRWTQLVALYEDTDEWASLTTATAARLLAARAYAETGHFDRALRSLQFVTLSPRTVAGLHRELWLARVAVVALAGDSAELENILLRREHSVPGGFKRFAAYWRGRCALVRDERQQAVEQLTRAQTLTSSNDPLWREVIAELLQEVEAGTAAREGEPPGEPSGETARLEPRPPTFAAQTEAYVHGLGLLRHAESQSMHWRDLMSWGRPAGATLVLLALMIVVYAVDRSLAYRDANGILHMPFQPMMGNVPTDVLLGEWWRLVTALFLHANELHLLTNGLTLWVFGSAVEKATGWWRSLLIFFVAGIAGNLLSATLGSYDVAVGASGAIFGFIGAFAVALYRLRTPIYASTRRRLLLLLTVTIAGDFSIGAVEPHLDNLAHIGGFLAGLALALLLEVKPRQPDAQIRGQRAGRLL